MWRRNRVLVNAGDIEALEVELNEFKFDEGGSDWEEGDGESSDNEWSELSERGENLSRCPLALFLCQGKRFLR